MHEGASQHSDSLPDPDGLPNNAAGSGADAVALSPSTADASTRDTAMATSVVAHHNSRLVERQSVLVRITLQSGDAQWLPGRVTDISHEGCRLMTYPDMLAPAMAVQIMFPGFEGRGGHVVWTDGDQAGCAFDQPLHPAILDYIIRMSDPAARGGGR